jgi:hypothetical protein
MPEENETTNTESEEIKTEEPTFELLSPTQEREALIENIIDAPDETEQTEEASVDAETTEEIIDPETDTSIVEEPEEKTIMEKIVIDGQESEVPLSEIIDAGKRTFQKETAADKRLEEATRLLKEAQEKTLLPAKDEEEKESIEDASERKQRIKELVEAIQYGDDEEAAAALEEVMQSTAQPQTDVSIDQIKNEIKEELRVEQINDKLLTPPEDGGFGDLAEDPKLIVLANQAIDAAMAKGERYTWELCREACQGVRDWVDSFKPKTEHPKDDLQERRERKKALDEVKSANLKNVKAKDPAPQTASQIVAEMRKVRGQN